ncbi:hypothetical protein Tco_1521698 [Tanacetum coccineum]
MKLSSLKLIDPINGVNKLKPRSTKSTTPSTSSEPSTSNNDLNILRCNNRLLNSTSNRPPETNDIDVEVNKTIEVENSLGYDMTGKDRDVCGIIRVNEEPQ